MSLQSGHLPNDWKQAHVTPVYKKGSRVLAANYRPISLTSPIVKLLESIIRDFIMDHMLSNHLFTEHQHGFISGRSCTTQLLTALDYWSESLDKGYSVDIIYLDFRKAFDVVPHTRLLTKLEAYGVCGNLLQWIRNFLVGRKQRVVLNGCSSTWSNVLSGVPQGSVLGPLLFSLYVNDIPSLVDSPILLFADDTKVYRAIKCREDHLQLQSDIDKLLVWSNMWQLKFNIAKCTLLHLGKPHSYGDYKLDGVAISQSNIVKDLGVLIDTDLKFHAHTSMVVARANRLLGIIKKSFEHLDHIMFLRLYKSLIRPMLEYGNIIWGPYFTAQVSAWFGDTMYTLVPCSDTFERESTSNKAHFHHSTKIVPTL